MQITNDAVILKIQDRKSNIIGNENITIHVTTIRETPQYYRMDVGRD